MVKRDLVNSDHVNTRSMHSKGRELGGCIFHQLIHAFGKHVGHYVPVTELGVTDTNMHDPLPAFDLKRRQVQI